MNRTYICLALSFCLLFAACKKDEPTIPPKEEALALLPPATQTGANMMGCLIDGKPMTAGVSIWRSKVDCNYNFHDGISNFYLDAKDPDNAYMKIPDFGIGVAGRIYHEGTYPIWTTFTEKFSLTFGDGRWYFPKDTFGLLTITRLDTAERIISGTFSFLAHSDKNPNDQIKVTDGRFDFRYPY